MILSLKIFFIKLAKRPVFIIQIKDSEVKHIHGNKHVKFLNDCKDIARDNKLTKGLIYAVKDSSGTTRIKISSEIPQGAAQRMRNVWGFYLR